MKKLIKFSIATLLILCLVYTGVWFGIAHVAKKGMAGLENHKSIQLSPAPNTISGFPFWPKVTYSGKISTSKMSINVKNMAMIFGTSGNALTLKLKAPNGFTLTDKVTRKPQTFKSSHLILKAPFSPRPSKANKEGLKQWRDNGGKIIVSSLNIKKDKITMTGAGTITLDSNLQPSGKIDLNIKGYDTLLSQLSKTGITKNISKEKLAIANSILGVISGKKEKAVPSSFKTPLTIKNRKIYIGPMRIAKMQKIHWPE